MGPESKLLLIDDDATLVKALDIYLTRAGYAVDSANNGAEGLKKMYQIRPDLIVLDVMMPQLDGWETCRRIREMSTVPVIMLTARNQEAERVKGLRIGADDYVPKPFSLKELEARIGAVLRRSGQFEPAQKQSLLYVTNDLIIDAERWEVRRDGERIELTSTELRLLLYLAENAGRVLSHQQLLEEVWGPAYVDNVDYTKLFIWRLRRKIEREPSHPRYILTERGIGYRMVPANEV